MQENLKRKRENPLECDLIIVDEASMIDTLLMNSLLKAIPSSARYLYRGYRSASERGAGNVLKDLIASEKIPVRQLKQIFRQAAGSRISQTPTGSTRGTSPIFTPSERSDFQFIEIEEPEEILEEIVEPCLQKLPKSHRFHRFDEIQVLAPMKRGVIGTENLNVVLQQQSTPPPPLLLGWDKTSTSATK